MPSGVFDSTLLKHVWSTDELRAIFNDENRVQKWYDYEAALALSQAELGIIPQAAATEIAGKAKVGNVDLDAIAAEVRRRQASAGAGAARTAGDLRWRPRRISAFRARPRRTCSTPASCSRSRRRTRCSCAICSDIGRELYRLAETVQDTPMAAAPTRCRRCRSPSATRRDLAGRDRPQLPAAHAA